MASVTATLTAENTWTDLLSVPAGVFTLAIAGLTGGAGSEVTAQVSLDQGSTWQDVESFLADEVVMGVSPGALTWRFGIKTGDFGLGDSVVITAQRGAPLIKEFPG